MKNCKKCSETKPLNEFHKSKATNDGLQRKCKECVKKSDKQRHLDNPEYFKQYDKHYRLNNKESLKEYTKQWSLAKKDGYHSVYLLPKHNYVGITENLYIRMSHHRSLGRDTTGYRILETFQDRELGLELEELLHDIGYEGRNENYSKL